MTLTTDELTTIAGGIAGGALILAGFGAISRDQSHAIAAGAPLMVAALGVIVQGYYTNKR